MDTALTLLAVAGAVAVAGRLLASAGKALRQGVDGVVAREVADARAQRGDLTGMAEAERQRQRAVRARRRALTETAGWAVLLAAPVFTPWTRPLYAAYFLAWAALRLRSGRPR